MFYLFGMRFGEDNPAAANPANPVNPANPPTPKETLRALRVARIQQVTERLATAEERVDMARLELEVAKAEARADLLEKQAAATPTPQTS